MCAPGGDFGFALCEIYGICAGGSPGLPGDAGRGGGQRGEMIETARKALLNALLSDPDCISFMATKGANVLGTLKNISITADYIGGSNIQAETQNDELTIDNKAPANPNIVINTGGFFFMNQNALGFQGSVLLHELGHATGVLVPDAKQDDAAATAKLQAHDNEALQDNCSKTLNSLGKP